VTPTKTARTLSQLPPMLDAASQLHNRHQESAPSNIQQWIRLVLSTGQKKSALQMLSCIFGDTLAGEYQREVERWVEAQQRANLDLVGFYPAYWQPPRMTAPSAVLKTGACARSTRGYWSKPSSLPALRREETDAGRSEDIKVERNGYRQLERKSMISKVGGGADRLVVALPNSQAIMPTPPSRDSKGRSLLSLTLSFKPLVTLCLVSDSSLKACGCRHLEKLPTVARAADRAEFDRQVLSNLLRIPVCLLCGAHQGG